MQNPNYPGQPGAPGVRNVGAPPVGAQPSTGAPPMNGAPPVGGPPAQPGGYVVPKDASGISDEATMPYLDPAAPIKTIEDLHVDELLHIVVDLNASDLHVCANMEPVVRDDGVLKRLSFQKLAPTDIQRMMYDIISDENIHKYETTLELDFSYQLPRRARFRVNMYRDRGSVAGAFRLIAQKIPTVKELNLPPILETLTEKPRGLILVTGPTGSGKSTSLAAMLHYINQNRSVHIITIEDPIEYLHVHKKSLINQREVRWRYQELSAALRASLREDPDVLLVGEMRDQETIQLGNYRG